ncbi:hypothetical protein ACFSTC_59195 [Nonomuraea ferruginea]
MESGAFRHAFAVTEFRALWGAMAVVRAGTQLGRVALAVLAYERTGSAAVTALVYALTLVLGAGRRAAAGRAGGPVPPPEADRRLRPGEGRADRAGGRAGDPAAGTVRPGLRLATARIAGRGRPDGAHARHPARGRLPGGHRDPAPHLPDRQPGRFRGGGACWWRRWARAGR